MKKILLSMVSAAILATSCSDFEQINVNPNNPPMVPSEMLLPPIISSAVSSMTASGTRAGQYVQHLSWLGGTSEGDGRYNLTGASYREEWNGAMRLIKDVNQLKINAKANNQPAYEAIGYICKVYILSLMSDAYGDIPYTEAGRGNEAGMEFPHYQSQKDVYKLMIEDLETANQLLSNLPAETTVSRDILYNGNMVLWRKFANSLKVRILMRESQKNDVATEIKKIFDNPTQYPVFTSVADQATLVYNNSPDYYRWYIQNPPTDGSGVNFGGNERVSDIMVNLLKRDNDPRLPIYAAPTKKTYLSNKENPANHLEYRGQRTGLSEVEQTELYNTTGTTKDDYSVIGKRIRKENRAFLITYCELLLLKTEAIHRSMISGDATATYKTAIIASFDKWDNTSGGKDPFISTTEKNDYLQQTAIAFNPSKAIQQIAEQLWIDSYLNGFEGWAGWRRLGYPQIVPGPTVKSPVPVRYVYSDNEQNNPNLIKWVNEQMGGVMPDHNVKVWFQP